MKKLSFILLTLFLFSCVQSKDRWQIIEEKEKSELASGIKNDTIFLNFVFGMTENEVNQKFKQLLEQGKISIRDEAYEYKFSFDYPSEANATFRTKYFNNKLYQFALVLEQPSQVEATLVQLKLVTLFMDKYGIPIKAASVLKEKENDYIFIQGNRKVEICYPFYNGVILDYTDIIVEKEMRAFDQKQKIQQDSIAKKDI